MKKILIKIGNTGKYVKYTNMLLDGSAKGVNRENATLFSNPQTVEHVLGKFMIKEPILVVVEIPTEETEIKSEKDKYKIYSEILEETEEKEGDEDE